MKLELYNCARVCVYIFPSIHIQSGGPINDIRLNIQKPARNGSRSNGKEIIGSGMSLYKVHFLKIWVVRAFIVIVLKKLKKLKAILAPNTLKIPTTSEILYLKNFNSHLQQTAIFGN